MSTKGVYVKSVKQLYKISPSNELKLRNKRLLMNSSITKASKYSITIPTNSDESLSKVDLRCKYTGRKKGLIRKIKMTRMFFKEQVFKGYIPGIRKSSW